MAPLLWFLWFTAGSAAQTPHQVFAIVGEAVILPCSLWNRTLFDDSPTVEWTRADLKPKAALVYRDNGEVFEMKHQRFEFRTSLFHREVRDGNVSLRVSDVQLSDAGMFYCLKIPKEYPKVQMENSTVELVVALKPNIALISFDYEKMVVECEARCWQTKPQMKILDDRGRTLIGKETEDPGGCSTMKQRVTLQHSAQSNWIFCRVEFPKFNQSRTTKILIPEHTKLDRSVQLFTADCLPYATIACISSVILIGSWGLFLLRKKLQRCAGPCLPHTMPDSYINRSSFQQLRTDSSETQNSENCLVEQHEREPSDLKSELQKKDFLITNLKRQLYASQHFCVVCRLNNPTVMQEVPADARKLLDSFESSASSSENDQDLLMYHKVLKHSGFTQKKQPQAEISELTRESVPSGKSRKKKSVVRLRSYPGENVKSTQSSLPTSSSSHQNKNFRQRRPSLDPLASGNIRKEV